jgi:hypothetical protein
MLTFQVFKANPNATVEVIAEEVVECMSRVSELTQAQQVVGPFVSSLISSQAFPKNTKSFLVIPMDSLSFLEQEIKERGTIVTEEEKEVKKYELESISSDE